MSNNKEEIEDKETENDEEEIDNPDEMPPQQKLFYFAKRGDVDGIKEVANAADINKNDDIGFKQNPYISQNTALHYAVQSGNLQCVKVLYHFEAKLDVTNKLGSTPLHIAAALGHAEIAQFLIEMKANIEAKNVVQNTPLHCAVYAGHVDTVKVILSKLDEPRDALLEPNGVGMGAAKYTAHDEMKTLLRTYFPKRKENDNEKKEDQDNQGDGGNDVQEEEVDDMANNQENNENISNPTDYEEPDGDNNETATYQ